MKSIRSNYLASAAMAASLALPGAALAQSTAAPAPVTPPPAATASPLAAQPAPGNNAEQRVETHIRQLHAQLRITPAEQPQWDQFAQVMRDNAKDMDQLMQQRTSGFATMSAVENLQSYARIAQQHAEHTQKLAAAFQALYADFSDAQKKHADVVFRSRGDHAMRGKG